MKSIDDVIDEIKQGIKRQEMLMDKINPETEIGRINIQFYKLKIRELEYRIRELEEKKKGNTSSLIPKYGDGKYASNKYKEAFDILRVCYYKYFYQDLSFSPVPKVNVMFYDSTLFLPVDTFLVKGKIPFQIMFRDNYPNYKSDTSKSVSIELPFEVLSKEENEKHLKCMLELIKIYSGDNVNLVFGNGISTRATLSYIAEKEFLNRSWKRKDYYDFFDSLCDNIVRNIIYIGDSIKNGVEPEEIEKVQSEIIDMHRRLIVSKKANDEELQKANEKIKQRILSINNNIKTIL